MDLSRYAEIAQNFIVEYGIKVIGAIVIWIVGSWIIKKITKGIGKVMSKNNYDVSLQKFLLNLIGWGLKILLFLAILSQLGIETTSFAAILAAAGLAIGMALQGSLGNFAGGVLIMIFKPFKIGDLIEAQGELGVVKEIEIFTTKILSPTNKEIIIPNGALSNGNITNYSTEGMLRVDLTIGVSYDSDIKQTKEVLMNVLTSNPKVLKDPAPSVSVAELADSSVNFAVRPYATIADYWDVYFGVTEGCKLALDKAGIEIPYPHQVEIHKEG
ncbi:mechanosensitive ion channel domain-containing protein [Seonamhaeicola sp.]|uniref:mechanosensitive ion channel family protein n=1 Tax=Seonamhaeicola sp. TaxID=1912245 RepID=UPI00262FE518|nr:mechanosensitive ion channel domain-containing protein [Seonamhaeicola sp.]